MPQNVNQLPIKMGDLSRFDMAVLSPALTSDLYLVFGASYIKGPLCDYLVANRALNIHMRVSPYYRGSSCNFWAMYDSRPDLVGANIHLLTKGLDSGPILFHAFPKSEAADPFVIGMKAVKSAHRALVRNLDNGQIYEMEPVVGDKSAEMRYARSSDFTDAVAEEYLNRIPSAQEIRKVMESRDEGRFVRPFVDT